MQRWPKHFSTAITTPNYGCPKLNMVNCILKLVTTDA
jgi:hypothetical protein